ncbi:MAG: DUF2029 domain-containing protein [Frankiales bacterium]|nr:DUF2029 domain-containing protein [Frankiales bacterium]
MSNARHAVGPAVTAVAEPAAPSRSDPVVAAASRLTGGPHGRFARGRTARWWGPLRVLLMLTVLTSVLGFLAKAPCRTHSWSDGNDYQYTRLCYTDVYALYFSEHLGSGPQSPTTGEQSRISVPYRDHPVEYPPVIGGIMWAAAEVTNMVRPDDPQVVGRNLIDKRGLTFFDITALLLAGFALVTTWALARLVGRRRIWDVAMFALAPTLLLHAYTNWDLAAVALATLALWAWSRPWPGLRAPLLAGVFIGLGTATKLYPALFCLGLLALCWRSGRLRHWAAMMSTAVVSFVLAYLPAVVLSAQTSPALRRTDFLFPDKSCATAHYLPGWRWFWQGNATRPSDWDSLWFQLEHHVGPLDSPACGQAPGWLDFGVGLATVIVIAAVTLLTLLARRRPRVGQVLFLLVAGFLLVNKVDSPQYVLWLLPLAVLARPRWPAFLVWQLTEAVLLVARYLFFVNNDAAGANRGPVGIPINIFFGTVLIRDVALAVVMGLVVREVLHPETDVVRRDGVDDPAGGVLDEAPDRWDDEANVPTGRAAPALS